ncbi:MAG: hypothetical protein SFX18_11925 [Pirellulales bacterium]|nr:hypothetical protein [Pirellulales bacterium]
MSTAPPPVVSQGIVFHRSWAKSLGLLVVLAFLGFFICLPFTVLDNHQLGRSITLERIIRTSPIATILIILTVVYFAFNIYFFWLLWLKRRVILGKDRLQIVERWKMQDRVILQIPYYNITDVQVDATHGESRLGIDLRDLEDLNTFAPRVNYQRNKELYGRHICLDYGYVGGPSALKVTLDQLIVKLRA